VLRAALEDGVETRSGFEDTVDRADGTRAVSNAQLIDDAFVLETALGARSSSRDQRRRVRAWGCLRQRVAETDNIRHNRC
jgi:uncharacterized protein (DUF849 family)